MNKPLTTYAVMTSILKPNINPTEDEIKKINAFFFCRYLASDPRSINIANFYNRFYNQVPMITQYKMAKAVLAGRISWINVPKTPKNQNQAITNLCRYYKISEAEALDYYEIMPENKREEFATLYPDE